MMPEMVVAEANQPMPVDEMMTEVADEAVYTV